MFQEFNYNLSNFQFENVGSNTTFTIPDLVRGQEYYVNIFLSNASFLSIPYARTNFVFEKFRIIGLRDGIPALGNLTSLNGKLSFRYKVSVSPPKLLVKMNSSLKLSLKIIKMSTIRLIMENIPPPLD